MAPNQELGMQIVRVAQSVLPEIARRMVQQCIGGANINNQLVGAAQFCLRSPSPVAPGSAPLSVQRRAGRNKQAEVSRQR